MSRCYHNDLEVVAVDQIEVATEADIEKEYTELKNIKCKKNRGHEGFIPYKDLTLEDIPKDVRTEAKLNEIKRWGRRVVRLELSKIIDDKKIKKAGTGFVIKIGTEYHIQTNFHVIQTDDDVKNCIVEFFYDSYNRSGIFKSKGLSLGWTCPTRDVAQFTFDPVPPDLDCSEIDIDLQVVISYKNRHLISKTHLHHKPIQPYHFTDADLNDPEIEEMFLRSHNESISKLSSSYFRFQPIPGGIRAINNINICVDKDDGNSTVISGDVLRINYEYVVRISEFIFQDKVKKYSLEWNGEVLRGTRLYFQQFESREFFDDKIGVDFEMYMKKFPGNVWLFDCRHPKPQEMERYSDRIGNYMSSDILCCIGHPHAGIKMVTFGRWLGTTVERFDTDNEYERILHPGKNDQLKEVQCVKYSCKTCRGSSGSPVLCLNRLSFGMTPCHFMGDRVHITLSNDEVVENVNIAWLM